jgi:methylated-DNA-[protein]-cysteine S-methyltransferase
MAAVFDHGAQMNPMKTNRRSWTSARILRADGLVVPSPIGCLTLHAAGEVLAAVHLGWARSSERALDEEGAAPVEPVLRAAAAQLAAYFSGELREFSLPLRPAGTPFQLAVWEALRRIPYGGTVSYGELAARLGRRGAARAVGRANALNPLPVIIPCHRVIGADRTLTGYVGGLDAKRMLLALEASTLRGRASCHVPPPRV